MSDMWMKQSFLVLASLAHGGVVSRREAVINMGRIADSMGEGDYLVIFGATPVGRVRDMIAEFGDIRIEPDGFRITEKGRNTLAKLANHMAKEYGEAAYQWAGLHME